MAFPSPTKTYHSKSYPAISTDEPALSQSGKNVVITGAGTGIGQGIALAFAKANVKHLAVLGRTLQSLQETKLLIDRNRGATTVHIYSADISDQSSLDSAFAAFAKTIGGPIHTLVANAAIHPGLAPAPDENGDTFMSAMKINALGTVNSVRAYLRHIPATSDETGYRGQVVHVSSGAAHGTIPLSANYSASKAAAAFYLQFVALEHSELRVISYHPGGIETPMNRMVAEQMPGVRMPSDDVSLPSDFAVWAASKESLFLGSGRFLWAHWDVTELREKFERIKAGIEKDGLEMMGLPVNRLFTIGLVGWA